ncbi:MAG: PAS domain S-box protein [Myxococcota bacterium]
MANTLELARRRPDVAVVLGGLVMVLAAPGLVSLVLGAAESTAPLAGLAMRPMSAVGLLGLGVALLCHAREGPWRTPLGRVAALSAAVLGAATISQALLPDSPTTRAWLDPQFHAPGLLAGALTALGVSLGLGPYSRVSAGAAVLGLAGAVLILLAGAYDTDRAVTAIVPVGPSPSVTAEIATLLAALGALLRHRELRLVAALRAADEVGSALRRSLIAAAIVPSLFGQLALAGNHAGFYGDATGTALLAVGSMTALLVVAFAANGSLRRAQIARTEADEALEESERRYRDMVDRAAVGIAQLGADGRWLHANARVCEMLGFTPEELTARTYADVSDLEDLSAEAEPWELLRRGEIPEYTARRRFVGKQGRIVHAEVTLARDIRSRRGAGSLVAVIQDLTVRDASESTLRVYERAIAATQNGVVITDARKPNHPIVSVNAAFERITGYAAAEVLGKNCRFLNEAARGQAGLERLRRAIQAGEACTVMLRNFRRDGTGFWNNVSVAPVHDADGRLTHFVGAMVDATEQVQLVAEREALLQVANEGRRTAESATEAKDRFLSVISHELRSPMNAVVSWASLLREEADPTKQALGLDAIEAAVSAQTRLVDDLLDTSRIRSGGLGIDFAEIDLAGAVQTAVSRHLQTAHEKRIALRLQLPSTVATCYADGQRVEQIFDNLLDNALKFTPSGGSIQVELVAGAGSWEIAVRDTGRGLAESAREHVFEEFWQADVRGGRGLGLGLAIVKHLVERQGGAISVESAGPGLGATFRVTLPMVRAAEIPAAGQRRPARAVAPIDLAGALVVVVDDDATTAAAFANALAHAGAVPRIAHSVEVALRLFAESPVALISDISMPDRDGFDLIRTVRSSPEPSRGVLAIAVTALSDREDRKRIQRAGFDACLVKPVEPRRVVARLAELRARLAQEPPPARSLLALGDERTRAAGTFEALRADGHDVLEVADANAVLREATQRRPDAILVAEPVREPAVARLTERLTSLKARPAFVGLIEPGAEPAQPLSDYMVPLEDIGALRRVLCLLEEPPR